MSTLVIVVHIITCLFLIMFVLLQAGKGAEVGATFGGISQTFFGSQGGNVLTKITTVLAFLFMITSIGLTIIQHKEITKSVMQDVPVAAAPVQNAPATNAPTTGGKTDAPKTETKK